MSDDLKEKLKTEIEEADWSMLKPHYEKDSVVLVSEKLDLLDVGVAVAQDKSQIVGLWLQDKLIEKLTPQHAAEFNMNEYKKAFRFIIIQPFVLIQKLEEELLN